MNRRIIDCFPFFNEIGLLQVRLAHLFDIVDVFVVIEATKTHRGDNKPMYFEIEDQKGTWSPWRSKIMRIVVRNLPSSTESTDHWLREMIQRHASLTALAQLGCQSYDIIISSDVDEIPDRYTLSHVKQIGIKQLYRLEMDMYVYNTFFQRERPWTSAVIFPYSLLSTSQYRQKPFQQYPLMAMRHAHDTTPTLQKGGWHFSFFGSIDKIQMKLASYAHHERDSSNHQIIQRWKQGHDPSIDTEPPLKKIDASKKHRYLPEDKFGGLQLTTYVESYRIELLDGKNT